MAQFNILDKFEALIEKLDKVKEELHDRDRRIAELEEVIKIAKIWTPIFNCHCPLCDYRENKLVNLCSSHQAVKDFRKIISALRSEIKKKRKEATNV